MMKIKALKAPRGNFTIKWCANCGDKYRLSHRCKPLPERYRVTPKVSPGPIEIK